MDVFTCKFQLVMVGELGYFLDHFFYLVVAEAGSKAGGFNFQVGSFEYEAAVIKMGILRHELVEVDGIAHFAYFGAEDGLFTAGYGAFLIGSQDGLKATPIDGDDQYRFGVIVICKLTADLFSVLLNVFHNVHR